MAKAKARVKAPKTASKGEVVTIKTLMSHPMESGQRKDEAGNKIPRKIINKFTASYNEQAVFAVDLAPSISANPFIEFQLKVNESGSLKLEWHEDGGEIYTKTSKITVQ